MSRRDMAKKTEVKTKIEEKSIRDAATTRDRARQAGRLVRSLTQRAESEFRDAFDGFKEGWEESERRRGREED